MSEVITIQLGHLANRTGAYFWQFEQQSAEFNWKSSHLGNAQPGNPRAIAVDLKGSLSSITVSRGQGSSSPSEEHSSPGTWSGKSTVIRRPGEEAGARSLYDEKMVVEFLPDSRAPYVSAAEAGSSASSPFAPFSWFSEGTAFARRSQGVLVGSGEEVEDSIRRAAELCDALQGYQVLVDIDSGFSGATSHFLQHLADEYAKSPIFTFSLDSPANLTVLEKCAERRGVNLGLGLHAFHNYSSVVVPLSNLSLITEMSAFPHLHVNMSDYSHVTTLFAAGINTAMAPSRLAGGGFTSLGQLASNLVPGSHMNIAALSLALPFPIPASSASSISQLLSSYPPLSQAPFMASLTPLQEAHSSVPSFASSSVLRGFPSPSHSQNALDSPFLRYLSRSAGQHQLWSVIDQPLFVSPSFFPGIFLPSVAGSGLIRSSQLPSSATNAPSHSATSSGSSTTSSTFSSSSASDSSSNTSTESHLEPGPPSHIPVATELRCTPNLHGFIRSTADQLKSSFFKNHALQAQEDMMPEDVAARVEDLLSLADSYEKDD